MTELAELEKRIADALERVRAGLDGMASAPSEDMVPAAEADALAAQLTAVTADLSDATEALAAEKARADALASQLEGAAGASARADSLAAQLAAMEAEYASQAEAALSGLEDEVRGLRATVQELQTANAELRRAALDGVTDPTLINAALAADLAALQKARLSEMRDLDAILRALSPVIEEADHA